MNAADDGATGRAKETGEVGARDDGEMTRLEDLRNLAVGL